MNVCFFDAVSPLNWSADMVSWLADMVVLVDRRDAAVWANECCLRPVTVFLSSTAAWFQLVCRVESVDL